VIHEVSDEDVAFAWTYAQQVHSTLGTWAAVGEALKPYLDVSPAVWWWVGEGQRITKDKVRALKSYRRGCPLCRTARSDIKISRKLFEMLNEDRVDAKLTWEQYLRALLTGETPA